MSFLPLLKNEERNLCKLPFLMEKKLEVEGKK